MMRSAKAWNSSSEKIRIGASTLIGMLGPVGTCGSMMGAE
jgi:hypothetical protein